MATGMKRALLLPLRPAPLILVGVFGAGLRVAVALRILGIPIAVILVSWFFKYCFAVLDSTVAGEEEPPVLSLEMIHPFDEQRPLAELFVIAVGAALAGLAGSVAGEPGLVLAGAVLLALLPATVAALGVTASPLRAASPVVLARLIRGLGHRYAGLVLATLALASGLYALVRLEAPIGLTLVLGELAFLFVFALIGAAVHASRLGLGLATLTREERRAERELREHLLERSRMLDRSFAQLRLGRTADSWSEIERWIAAHCRDERADAEFAALIDSTMQWAPPAVTDRLVSEYLARLLRERDNGRALETLERRLAAHPKFRPAPPADALRLRELAGLAGKRALTRQLETDP